MSITSHQIIQTEGCDQLVVLTRAEYDALHAAAGDVEAEIRAASRIVADSDAAIANGTESIMPAWLAIPIARGQTALKVVRKYRGRTRQELAASAGITRRRLSALESGMTVADTAMHARLADELAIDPAWLEPV